LLVDGDLMLNNSAQIYAGGKVHVRGNITTSYYANSISSTLYADGTTPQTFSLASGSNLSSLHVLNKTGITIHGRVTMDSLFMDNKVGIQADSMFIRKNIVFDSGIIHIQSPGVADLSNLNFADTVGNKNSYVDGAVLLGPLSGGVLNVHYPIGTAKAYRPLNLAFEKFVNDVYTIKAIDQPAPVLPLPAGISGVSTMSYYTVKPLRNYVFSHLAITIPYVAADGVTDPANLRIVRDSAEQWVNIGGTGTNAGTGSITSTAKFTLLGNIALANATGGTNTLPVTWLNFTAAMLNNSVVLRWNVAHETSVSHYTPEYSTDGIHFIALAQLNAYNSLGTENVYQFTHTSPAKGLNYYRIKETDKDGKYAYSKIISISVNDRNSLILSPNPAHEAVTITMGDIIKEIDCYNAVGQLVKKISPASNTYILPLKELANGVYTIKVITATGTYNTKVVKQ